MTNTKSSSTDPKAALGQLETILDEYLVKKAPFQIPDNIKEILVQFAPWITLIVLLMALPALLFVLGMGSVVAPFAYLGGVRAGTTLTVAYIFTIVALVLEAIALPGLFNRKRSGWNFVFYASLVSLVEGVVSGNIVSALVGAIIELYVLFQLKEKYQ
jgi:hypothetical protein